MRADKIIDSTNAAFRAAVGAVFDVLRESSAPQLARVKAIVHVYERRMGTTTDAPNDPATVTIVTDIERALHGVSEDERLHVVAEIMDRSPLVRAYEDLGEDGFIALAKMNVGGWGSA